MTHDRLRNTFVEWNTSAAECRFTVRTWSTKPEPCTQRSPSLLQPVHGGYKLPLGINLLSDFFLADEQNVRGQNSSASGQAYVHWEPTAPRGRFQPESKIYAPPTPPQGCPKPRGIKPCLTFPSIFPLYSITRQRLDPTTWPKQKFLKRQEKELVWKERTNVSGNADNLSLKCIIWPCKGFLLLLISSLWWCKDTCFLRIHNYNSIKKIVKSAWCSPILPWAQWESLF